MQQSTKPSSRKRWVGISIGLAALVGLLVYFSWPWLSKFTNPEEVRELLATAGPWAPLVFILMQVIQVLVAPIPGQVTGLVGGLLFGTFWGVVYTMIGATIGFTLIFVLARRLGRPFVDRFVSPKLLERFDYLSESGGAFALFLIYLLPAFPDDIISFIAGLTTIRFGTLILVSLAGRLPGYIVLSATGAGLAYENMNPIVVLAGVTVAIFAIGYWKRAWLQDMASSGDVSGYIRERWAFTPVQTVFLLVGLIALGIALYALATVEPIPNLATG